MVPKNTAGLSNNKVTIPCKWNGWTPGVGEIRWLSFIGGPSTGAPITNNQNVTDSHRYGVTGNHAAGEFNLEIKSLADNDVGEYACFSQLGPINYYGLYVLKVGKCHCMFSYSYILKN